MPSTKANLFSTAPSGKAKSASRMNPTPKTSDASGPTTAIQNSCPGRCESSRIRDTPPKKNSVIDETSMP